MGDWTVIGLGISLLGVFSFALWWQWLSTRQLPFPKRSLPAPGWPPWLALAGIAWWISVPVVLLSVRATNAEASEVRTLTLADLQFQCLIQLVLFAGLVLLLLLSGSGKRVDVGAFATPIDFWAGVWGWGASLAPVFLVAALLQPWRTEQHVLLVYLKQNPHWAAIVWCGLAAGLLAPIVEELMYRVILQGTLSQTLPPRIFIPITAVAFSAMHGSDAAPLLPLALILGFVYEIRRSYPAVVLTHALFNLLNLALTIWQARQAA